MNISIERQPYVVDHIKQLLQNINHPEDVKVIAQLVKNKIVDTFLIMKQLKEAEELIP